MAQKISKIDAHRLNQMAEKLPPLQASDTNGFPLFKWTRFGGAELLRQFPNGQDERGNDIVAGQWYWRRMPIMLSHRVNLRAAFVKGGMAEAEAYCKQVQEIYGQAIRPRTRIGALLTLIKLKLISPFLKWKHPMQEQAEFLAQQTNQVK